MGERADFVNTTQSPGDAEIGNRGGFEESSDPAVIARGIEQTRGEMSETIDAIQGRLEPERLSAEAKEVAHFAIDEAKGAVRELAGQASTAVREATVGRVETMTASTRDSAQTMSNDLFTTIKENPIPAALAAAGIGWLWMHRSTPSGYDNRMHGSGYGSRYYDAYGVESGWEGQPTGQQAQEMAGNVSGQVQERAGQMQHQVQDRAGQMQHQMQHQMRDRAGQVQQQAQGFWHMLEANPVAAGALGIAIGAIAGMAVPESAREHQLMGETRDRVIGNVQQVAGDALGKAQHIAAEAGQSAIDEAKSQGMMPGAGAPA